MSVSAERVYLPDEGVESLFALLHAEETDVPAVFVDLEDRRHCLRVEQFLHRSLQKWSITSLL